MICTFHQILLQIIRWAWNLTRMGGIRNNILIRKHKMNRPHRRFRRKCDGNFEMEIEYNLDWIRLP
jgi:hypothetical protein